MAESVTTLYAPVFVDSPESEVLPEEASEASHSRIKRQVVERSEARHGLGRYGQDRNKLL